MEDLQENAEKLFVTVLELDPVERPAYLSKVCHDSPSLRKRVEQMLKENEVAGSFLEHPLFNHAPLDVSPTAPKTGSPTRDRAAATAYKSQFTTGEILLDRFVVIRFIARGGMGEVYEVEDRQLRGVHVALKTILSHYAGDPLMQERFEREVLSAREVVHPNLCPIYDIFHWKRSEGELTFLTMKLLAGETLAARLVRSGPLPVSEAAEIIRQVGAGLSAAHDAGILHRDIKAANIILEGVGDKVHVCVTDFGLARAASSDSTALTVGVAGTPGYMAPELFFGASPSKASDVYSFGVLAHQILTCQLPLVSAKGAKGIAPQVVIGNIPMDWRAFIEGCLHPNVSKRFATIPEAMNSLPLNGAVEAPPTGHSFGVSRRRAIALSAAVGTGLAGAVWAEWKDILNILEPLPKIRSVALMAWPTGESPALLSTILEAICQRLARAEPYVKGLLILSPKDAPTGSPPVDSPEKSETVLGANLVLTASLHQDATQDRLLLQLLEARSQHVLRKGTVSSPPQEISSMAEKGSREAASLLHLPGREIPLNDPEELRNVSQEVFKVFGEAEELVRQPNHAGLQQAVAGYQRALDLDRHFALGYAKLAMAYIQQFVETHEAANIDLAEKNASLALLYNPNSAMGLVSRALVLSYSGKNAEAASYFAKALKADPGNPEVLLSKAQALLNQDKWEDAAHVYNDILVERPNYWPAYNNLGVALSRAAKYDDAAKAFARAGMAAPKVALPMANLGQTYVELGRVDDARNALTESLSRGESEDAYLGLGDIEFEAGKYNDALKMYAQAARLDPRYHLIQRNIGDCYAMLGNAARVKEYYQRAARLLSDSLSINPQSAFDWANLAFYHAKIGDISAAESDIKNSNERGAKTVATRFMIVQALSLMGRRQEALNLLLWCMDKGLSPAEVNLAVDLKGLRNDPRYLSQLAKQKSG